MGATKQERNEKYRIDIYKIYPLNVITEIRDDYKDYSYSIEGILWVIENMLTERETKCIEMFYKDYMTLEQIGKEFGIGKERIRQVIAKAKRKLRHPDRFNRMRSISVYDYRYLLHEAQCLKRDYDALEESYINLRDNGVNIPPRIEGVSIRISELDLSVRTYNCLKRYGCETLGDICNLTEEETERIRNLGRKSLKEIKEKLMEYGCGFRKEDE